MTRSLTSIEASKLLRKHVVTVREMANAGTIPAAKIGSDWLFLEEDLLAHIRGQYRRATTAPCPSTTKITLPSGTRTSASPAPLAYVDRLKQRIESRRNASTTNGKRSYGSK